MLKVFFFSSTNAELMFIHVSGSEGEFNENNLSRGDTVGCANADESLEFKLRMSFSRLFVSIS